MRYVTRRIALLTAALMIIAIPVLAEESTGSKVMVPDQQTGKLECLLAKDNSCDRVGTPESRIDRIRDEINKGTTVYSNDELKMLNNELDKANSDLNDAYGGGA